MYILIFPGVVNLSDQGNTRTMIFKPPPSEFRTLHASAAWNSQFKTFPLKGKSLYVCSLMPPSWDYWCQTWHDLVSGDELRLLEQAGGMGDKVISKKVQPEDQLIKEIIKYEIMGPAPPLWNMPDHESRHTRCDSWTLKNARTSCLPSYPHGFPYITRDEYFAIEKNYREKQLQKTA